MKISYNWLQSFFKKKLPAPAKLADLLTMHAFETEVAGKGEADTILDVEVLPNRAHDCLSHLGIARETAALLKIAFKPINYAQKIKSGSAESVSQLVKVEVKDKKLCPRYTARGVQNVKIGPSPQWMQERLRACGLRPISNIVDIANYVMLETGQPLHAFDADKLTGQKLIIRRARNGEKMVSLDNEKYDLDKNVLVIADAQDPVCIAGIKGGINPGIDKQTKRVILESANFNPQIIRQASKQLKLVTDASWRFEHEIDPNLTEKAIDMAAYLIQEIANGQVLKERVDVYPNKVRPKKITLGPAQVERLLGIKVSDKEIKDILVRLDFGVKSMASKFQVTVPTRRLDVTMPEDLIEEIGRVYGFEKVPSQMPRASLIPAQRNEDLVYQNKVRDILANLGFSETYNYSLIGDKEAGIYREKPDLVELLNPISQEQKYLRLCLMPNLIKNVRENKKYFEKVRIFEIGQAFEKGSGKNKVKEQKRLAGVLSLKENNQPREFYRLKGVVDALLNRLRITNQWYDDELTENTLVPDYCHQSRRAEIKVDNQVLGWIGQISDSALKKLEVKSSVAGFELDFGKLVELATEERIYLLPSKYPAVVRDIALLVEPGTKVVEVLNLINSAGGRLVRDVDLFDIYEGANIPESKKNFAFHIIFQSNDHTLTDAEVNKLQEKIIKALEEEGGWEVRKQ